MLFLQIISAINKDSNNKVINITNELNNSVFAAIEITLVIKMEIETNTKDTITVCPLTFSLLTSSFFKDSLSFSNCLLCRTFKTGRMNINPIYKPSTFGVKNVVDSKIEWNKIAINTRPYIKAKR